jgi:hypothetical protein
MSPATAAPAMSAFVVFIWFLVSFFELPHSAAISHGEVLKIGWIVLRVALYEDYASMDRMELEYFAVSSFLDEWGLAKVSICRA